MAPTGQESTVQTADSPTLRLDRLDLSRAGFTARGCHPPALRAHAALRWYAACHGVRPLVAQSSCPMWREGPRLLRSLDALRCSFPVRMFGSVDRRCTKGVLGVVDGVVVEAVGLDALCGLLPPSPPPTSCAKDSPEPRCPSTTTCHPPRCSCGPGTPTATSNSSPPHRPDERRLPRRRRKRTRRAVGPRRVRSCSAGARATSVHIVPPPATVDRLDRRVDAANVPEGADQDTLVRLEQFRTGTTGHVPRRSQATGPIPRRAAAAGIVATAVAAIAIAYGTSGSRERSDQPASTPRAAAVVAVDSEHAAAIREVAPADSRVRNSRQPTSRKTHRTESKRRSVTASQNRAAPRAHHAPTVSGSHAAATVTSTVVRTAAPTPRHQAQAASATSEFGFEG